MVFYYGFLLRSINSSAYSLCQQLFNRSMKKSEKKVETRGRKKVPDGQRRRNIMRIYLTDEEVKRLGDATWARETLLEAAR